MKVVSVAGQKGGPGKSTVSVHLGVCAEAAGVRTAIIDTDAQATAFEWSERRKADGPQVVRETSGDALGQIIRTARANRIGLVIIDVPGKAEQLALAACELADLVLSPIRPTQADLETLGVVKRIVRIAERLPQTFVMLNQCPTSSPGTIEDAKAYITNVHGLTLAEPLFHSRTDFYRPLEVGMTATEYSPGSKAAAEAQALFDWVDADLKLTAKDAR